MTINGLKGPFDPKNTKIGGYGRNAALNVQKAAAQNPAALAKETIQYTNPNNLMRSDAIGYALTDIVALDTNKSGAIESNELQQAFGGQNETSDALFKAIDTNKDNKIDLREQTAYVLFQDDPVTQFKGAYDEFEKRGLIPSSNDVTDLLNSMTPSKADGQMTPDERASADALLLSAPAISGEVLKGFQGFVEDSLQKFLQNNPDAPHL